MKVGITGGAGFIGSHVVDELNHAGHDAVVLDLQPPRHRLDVAYRRTDILRPSSLSRSTRGLEALFHLAAVSDVNEAHRDPRRAARVNVEGTANALEACRRNHVRHFVFASSVWVYAESTHLIDETAPLQSDGHVYTATKVAGESLCRLYRARHGLQATVLRYGIPYGPRMREALAIPIFLRRALAGKSIVIHGDGYQRRNFVYVGDLAEAHVRVLERQGINGIFNVASEECSTIRDVVETVQRVVGRDVPIRYDKSRPDDHTGNRVTSARARRCLGWAAATSLSSGLEHTLRSMRDVIAV